MHHKNLNEFNTDDKRKKAVPGAAAMPDEWAVASAPPEWAMQTVRAMQTGRSLVALRLENEEFVDLCRNLTDEEFAQAGGALHTDYDMANAMQDDGVDEALNDVPESSDLASSVVISQNHQDLGGSTTMACGYDCSTS